MATSASDPCVPVIAAAIGAGAALIVGVITAWTAGHRENTKWQRERSDRDQQWDRERTERDRQWQRERDERKDQWEREDSLRWVQDRQQAYGRFIADLRKWDSELLGALTELKLDDQLGTRTEIDKTEAVESQRQARDDLTLVEFLAPDLVVGQAGMVFRFYEILHTGIYVMSRSIPRSIPELQELSNKAVSSRRTLERSMRSDLGLAGAPVAVQPGWPAAPEAQDTQGKAGEKSGENETPPPLKQ